MITQQQMVELTKVSASTAHVAIMSGRVDYTQPFLHRKDKERRKYGPKFIVVNDKFWDYVKLMWDKYS
jgi:hypothetical protein